jgi:predicted AlkP superfamily phosphohydrolase/phosphomutase
LSNKRRVFIFGLDGATLDLIRPYVEEGYLPNFARVMKEGMSGELESTIQPNTPTAWSSFMTGTNPGKHGVFNFRARRDDSYEVRPINGADSKGDTIWQIASAAGLRVASINQPMTFPPQPVNGIMISGWDAPGRDTQITYPKNLVDELEGKFGPYIIDTGFRKIGMQQYDEWLDELDRMNEQRNQVVDYVYHMEDWDIFSGVYVCLDRAQHVLWRLIDPNHPYYDAELAATYGDRILHYHKEMDAQLGRILNWLGDDSSLVILSDHGFGQIYYGLRINKLLADLGLFRLQPDAAEKVAAGENGTSLVDWSQTKAYSFGYHGQIFVNLKGREPQGIVEPGQEYEEVRQFIIAELEKLEDPYTHGRLIPTIYRPEDIYTGPYVRESADILFQPRDMLYRVMDGWTYVDDAEAGVVSALPWIQNGAHRMNGTFMMWGPDVEQGKVIQGARIIDVAPTILHYLNQPVPENMDGRVLEEALDPSFMEMNPVRRTSSFPPAAAGEESPYSEDEMEQINERLKSLGYIL